MKESYKVFEIPLSQISLDKLQPRVMAKKAQISELSRDIKLRGQLIPVILTPFRKEGTTLILGDKALAGEHKFWLLDGERRYFALKKLGIKNATAIVRTDLSLLAMYEIQFATNTKRVQITRYEMATAIERYRKELFKVDPKADLIKKLHELTGFSYTFFKTSDLINTERPDVKEEIKSGKLSGNLTGEIHGAIKGKDSIAVAAVKEGAKDAYMDEVKKGRKHSPLDVRAMKSELRNIVDDEDYDPEEKRELARKTFHHFWGRRDDERDDVADFYHYLSQITEFKRLIKKWNLSGLEEKELDALASKLIELNDYFREERRKIHGKVGNRKR